MIPRTRRPTTPGEFLREEFLVPMGLTQRELAEHIGCGRGTISRLVNGRARMTAGMAVKLGAAFGTTAEFWLSGQRAVDLFDARATTRVLPPRIGGAS